MLTCVATTSVTACVLRETPRGGAPAAQHKLQHRIAVHEVRVAENLEEKYHYLTRQVVSKGGN